MTRSLAVAASLAVLAVPATASAATLTVNPQKRCYSSGETVKLDGAGFTPDGSATITRDGTLLGSLTVFPSGAFAGELTLAQNSGRRTKTYTATDDTNPTLTASAQITVSSVGVSLGPATGPPGRLMTIRAHGFSTGKTLWAHVRRKTFRRNLKLGALSGACGRIRTTRRLLPRDARVGVYTIQFDTFRRYKARRPVRDRYTITVQRG